MEIENKLSVLRKVAEAFNAHGITWAVGASLLLYFEGIVDDFHDLDLLIGENDVPSVESLLAPLGTMTRREPNAQYRTKAFLEYQIDGVELDLMAGFSIVAEGREHYFPLRKEEITKSIDLDGIQIPLHSVSAWKTYYALMGRIEKVQLIEQNCARRTHK